MADIKRLYDRARVLFYMLKAKCHKPYPFYVNLVINNVCDLKCEYCFGSYYRRPNAEISFEKFKELVDFLKERGTKYILMQGGEPFLHNDLGKMINYLNKKNIISAIVTNGQCPEKIKETPEIDLMDNICFSIDGAMEGNDKVRGKGSFDKVLLSIKEVKKHYKVPVRISSTIHKYVARDADFMAEWVKKNKVEWGINFLFKGDEKAGGENIALNKDEAEKYLNKVISYKEMGYPIFTTKKILKYALKWVEKTGKIYLNEKDLKQIDFQNPIKCQYGIYEIVIDEYMKIYPCQAMQGVFEAKSIINDGFDEAFENLKNKPCYSCYIPSMINTSAMINRDLGVIFETVFGTVKNRTMFK